METNFECIVDVLVEQVADEDGENFDGAAGQVFGR